MKKIVGVFVILTLSFLFVSAQQTSDSFYVQAKVWSRDANRQIQYSDWKNFGSKTVDLLQGFKPTTSTNTDKFGGDATMQFKASGFFTTTKQGNRWWIVDPLGNAFLNVAVNGLRLGKSPDNEKAFAQKFGNNENWIAASKQMMDENGFNTTGSWSEVETIKAYNKTAVKPIVYCTQLSLLGTFSQKQQKQSANKNYPTLANILNPTFKKYCLARLKELVETDKNDVNLFGHFSDNELPFQNDLIKEFLNINDTNDSAYTTAVKWIADKKIDPLNITKDQKEKFSGFVTNLYYQIVSESIKAIDQNHLYLGSRLHSSAKNNPYILAVSEKYIDIISINYYGNWAVTATHKQQWEKLNKPFIITEFYTKGEDTKMGNMSGAGWLVKTQADRGIHYQNFCLTLLQIKNCVGWHWFRYQDNDPNDKTADPSNNDANKGIVNTNYKTYSVLLQQMQQLNKNVYALINYFDTKK